MLTHVQMKRSRCRRDTDLPNRSGLNSSADGGQASSRKGSNTGSYAGTTKSGVQARGIRRNLFKKSGQISISFSFLHSPQRSPNSSPISQEEGFGRTRLRDSGTTKSRGPDCKRRDSHSQGLQASSLRLFDLLPEQDASDPLPIQLRDHQQSTHLPLTER